MIKVNGNIVGKDRFPDNSLLLKVNLNTPKQSSMIPLRNINIQWLYEDDSELFTIICLAKKYKDYQKFLQLPYVPNARQDRIKNDEDVFTLKYFCEIINDLGFEKVYVKDVHSNVSLALLNNVVNVSPKKEIEQIYKNYGDDDLLIFYPDEGAMKRYSEELGLFYTYGMKKRNWEDGKIVGYEIVNPEVVEGRNVLIIDDICSRGGTFYHASKALKEAGAKEINLFVSHLENTVLEGPAYNEEGLISKIYTTPSIFTGEDKLNKIKIID